MGREVWWALGPYVAARITGDLSSSQPGRTLAPLAVADEIVLHGDVWMTAEDVACAAAVLGTEWRAEA